MSYLPALSVAVRNRLLADTGSGGLFGAPPLVTGVFFNVAPVEQPFPFLTYDLAVIQQLDAFRVAHDEVEVRVHAWVRTTAAVSPSPLSRLNAIAARIIGDWTSQPYGMPPTYGLDRWTVGTLAAALPGPWVADTMERLPAIIDTDADDTIIHLVQPFSVHVSREGA